MLKKAAVVLAAGIVLLISVAPVAWSAPKPAPQVGASCSSEFLDDDWATTTVWVTNVPKPGAVANLVVSGTPSLPPYDEPLQVPAQRAKVKGEKGTFQGVEDWPNVDGNHVYMVQATSVTVTYSNGEVVTHPVASYCTDL